MVIGAGKAVSFWIYTPSKYRVTIVIPAAATSLISRGLDDIFPAG
jgi:hypothetical protein